MDWGGKCLQLQQRGLRVELDESSEKLGAKTATAADEDSGTRWDRRQGGGGEGRLSAKHGEGKDAEPQAPSAGRVRRRNCRRKQRRPFSGSADSGSPARKELAGGHHAQFPVASCSPVLGMVNCVWRPTRAWRFPAARSLDTPLTAATCQYRGEQLAQGIAHGVPG